MDYAGPVDDFYFSVIVDSHSKFMDVHVTKSTSSAVTISMLRNTFSNFGLPDIVVSDNASYFVSEEMEVFLRKNGIKHMTPAPYNPSSNGLAEREVKTFKEGLSKFKEGDIKTRVCRFLYNYRRSVHSSTAKAPAELMFNRNFRGIVEKIKPQSRKEKVLEKDCKFEKSEYKIDDAVFVKNYGKGNSWLEGKIIEILGVRNYKVQLKDFGNIVWKRHSDQLMPRYTSSVLSDSTVSKDNSCGRESLIPMFPSSQVNIPFSSELSDNPENGNNSPGSVDNSCCPSNVPEPQPLRRSSRVGKPPD